MSCVKIHHQQTAQVPEFLFGEGCWHNSLYHLVASPSKDCGPMLSSLFEHGEVLLILPGHHSVLRVIRLRCRQEGLDTEQHCPQRHGGGPLVLEDVQADGPGHAGDVGVPDLGDETHFGRVEGVCVWYFDF